MTEKQQIIYMQVRIMRLASEAWNLPIETISEIFSKFDVLQYIKSQKNRRKVLLGFQLEKQLQMVSYLLNRGMGLYPVLR